MIFKDLLTKVLLLIAVAFFISCDDGSGNPGTQPGINPGLISGTWNLKEIQIQTNSEEKESQRLDTLVFNEDGTMGWFGRYPPFLNSSTYSLGEASGTWAFNDVGSKFEYTLEARISVNGGPFVSTVRESFNGRILFLNDNYFEYFYDSTYSSGTYYSMHYFLERKNNSLK